MALDTTAGGIGKRGSRDRGSSSETPGVLIGRYMIRERLGAGAFGTVYRAYDPVLDRDVALKVPHTSAVGTAESRDRVLREAKAAGRLRHPNIVPVYDAGQDGETAFIAAAFIEGRTLATAIATQRVDHASAIGIAAKLADALHTAHEAGIVHRDVKPANVMLDARGEPLLMDFGLAQIAHSASGRTEQGMLLGTPAYMSPEQALGRVAEVGPVSDQYSLGVVLYEMLCRQVPFQGPPIAVLYQVREQPPKSPRLIDPSIEHALEAVCLRAMAKRREDRFAHCAELAFSLRQLEPLTKRMHRQPIPISGTRSAPVSPANSRRVALAASSTAQALRALSALRKHRRAIRKWIWPFVIIALTAFIGNKLYEWSRSDDQKLSETRNPPTSASADAKPLEPPDSPETDLAAPSEAPSPRPLAIKPLSDLRLKAGLHSVVRIGVDRGDFAGTIDVTLSDLPTGVTATSGSIPQGRDSTLIELLPEADAPASEAAVRVIVSAGDTRLEELLRLVVDAQPPPEARETARFEGAQAEDIRTDNGLSMELHWCPPGSFIMGSPPDEPLRGVDEGPVDVTLTRGFWIGRFEVTQAEWAQVMGTTFHFHAENVAGVKDVYGIRPSHPMHYVNFDDAQGFCRQLTLNERTEGRLPSGAEYRLPTEAQWEYACRARTTTATAFGSSLSSTQANFKGNLPYNGGARGPEKYGTVVEVGTYGSNEWGLCDMHGNVWEWCSDTYTEVLPGGIDPEVTNQGSLRVRRGGSWLRDGHYCRSASREGYAAEMRSNHQGFRVALVWVGEVESTANTQADRKESDPRPSDSAAVSPMPSGGVERRDNELGMRLCWCPPGDFTMGSSAGEPERSKREAQVEVSLSRGFWMSKFEVTQAQWETVMATTLADQARKVGTQATLYGVGPNYPMYYVNHDDATQFCVRFTASERNAGRLRESSAFQLPTEAQWEYACRAGTKNASSFGNSLSSLQANFDGDKPYNGGPSGPDLGEAVEVGSYSPNDWGLCDMHGNVWEWCLERFSDKLPGGSDPEVTILSGDRVRRGGSWSCHGATCRAANRGRFGSVYRLKDQGFRVVLVESGK